MELPVKRALQRAVAAHKEGNLQDAERLYRAILQTQSRHPDANHNLGVLAVSINKADAALPLFKIALEANPKIEQFWLSYIDALIKEKQYENAKQVLGRAKKQGVDADRLEPFEAQLLPKTQEASGSSRSPSQALINTLLWLHQERRFIDAEKLALEITQGFPRDAAAHSNLGATQRKLGKLDEAVGSYRQAIALKPDLAEAHNNLGITLQKLGRVDEAVTSYLEATALKTDYVDAYVNLGIAIKNVRFKSSNPTLYPQLSQLLIGGNLARPQDVAGGILSLLKHDIRIKKFLLRKTSDMSLSEATFSIESLDKLRLLHQLMRVCPLPELQFEELLITLRRTLLANLDKLELSDELIYFLSTLSIHCFTNEYVYIESDEETKLICELQSQISQTIAKLGQPKDIMVLCLAAYRPLHEYDWCQKLSSLDRLEDVKRRLIEEPLLEKEIAKDIPILEQISDDVSLKVQEQYEENPYPRWVKLGVLLEAKSITTVCDELKLTLHSEKIKNVAAPSILIAGCGTGQHSIGTSSRFLNCHVTAVDLSRASLAYAQRKSNELGFTNIDYLQADILHLHQMGREFDIVESVGVLHHMEEPMVGWRVLLNLLKPGGLMHIGVYSELARHHIFEIRKEITALGIGTSDADIRGFRKSLVESKSENHRLLLESPDFFSLSTMRDLVFHVQEHCFTLPQIKDYLDELGLKFCGFENQAVISNFRKLHGNEADIYDLELWHHFEKINPLVFSGMYQFWCQKALI